MFASVPEIALAFACPVCAVGEANGGVSWTSTLLLAAVPLVVGGLVAFVVLRLVRGERR